jgi:eukaryotic-like serine/threonine-protein kinase
MAGPVSRQPNSIARPRRLGRWEVIAKIAGGGMSAIYLGRRVDPLAGPVSLRPPAETTPDPSDPSIVALKIVRRDHKSDDRVLKMFEDEGQLLQRLVHPNIVRTLGVGVDEEQSYIAMELMLGTTFAAIHDTCAMRKLRLHVDIATWCCARIGEALHYAHELTDEKGNPLKLIHRDVNPQNIFATFKGEVKLFDFGMAKVTTNTSMSQPNIIAGKLPYLSPEQIMQLPLDRRSDIFALGTTLWELLTGRRLFRRETDAETLRAVHMGPIPSPREVAPDVPEPLANIVKKALERNRENRHKSAAELAKELDYYLRHVGATDIPSRLATLVDTIFPGEQKRQLGWFKPAITGNRPSIPPPPSSDPSLGTSSLPPALPKPSSVPQQPLSTPPTPRATHLTAPRPTFTHRRPALPSESSGQPRSTRPKK